VGGHDQGCAKGVRRGGWTGRSPDANAVAAESSSSWRWCQWHCCARVAVMVVVLPMPSRHHGSWRGRCCCCGGGGGGLPMLSRRGRWQRRRRQWHCRARPRVPEVVLPTCPCRRRGVAVGSSPSCLKGCEQGAGGMGTKPLIYLIILVTKVLWDLAKFSTSPCIVLIYFSEPQLRIPLWCNG
jgi:hypothetical protein